jgi:GNAT superfamily N-acetyltransferase
VSTLRAQMRCGPDFRERHTLKDGTHVVLRCIRPDDKDELRRQFHRLSPDSRYRRFFAGIAELSDEILSYLTECDGRNHFAVVAVIESLDLKTEEGIGVGRFVRLGDDPSVAEAAVTVVDDMQGKGLGRLLLETLVVAARERAIDHFRGEILASNSAMRHILERNGAVGRASEGGTLVFDVPLISTEKESGLREAFRAAAASMQVLLRHLYPPSYRVSGEPQKPHEPA